MANQVQQTKDIVESIGRLSELLKIREPRSLSAPVEADFLAIGLATIRLLLDFSIYLFITAMLVMGMIFLFSMGNEETLTRAKRTLNQSLIGLVITFSSFSVITFFADKLAGKLALEPGANVAIIFGTAYNLALIAASTGFVIVLLYSGVRFVFAGGNEESQAGAKRMMRAALYGILLTLGAYAISKFLMASFGAIPR